jgi:glucose uptake protein GlcU
VAGLGAWTVGALFIPTLALALGVWSGSSKLFEVVYTLLWYVGPANQFVALDYMGATRVSSRTPLVFLMCALILGALALAGRKRQIQSY